MHICTKCFVFNLFLRVTQDEQTKIDLNDANINSNILSDKDQKCSVDEMENTFIDMTMAEPSIPPPESSPNTSTVISLNLNSLERTYAEDVSPINNQMDVKNMVLIAASEENAENDQATMSEEIQLEKNSSQVLIPTLLVAEDTVIRENPEEHEQDSNNLPEVNHTADKVAINESNEIIISRKMETLDSIQEAEAELLLKNIDLTSGISEMHTSARLVTKDSDELKVSKSFFNF